MTTTTEQDRMAEMVDRIREARTKALEVVMEAAPTADRRGVMFKLRCSGGSERFVTMNQHGVSPDLDSLAQAFNATVELARLTSEVMEEHLLSLTRGPRPEDVALGRSRKQHGRCLPPAHPLPVVWDNNIVEALLQYIIDICWTGGLPRTQPKTKAVCLTEHPDGHGASLVMRHDGAICSVTVSIPSRQMPNIDRHALNVLGGSGRKRDSLFADLERGMVRKGDVWSVEHSKRVDP